MGLRILLVLVAVVGLSVSGCSKKEPTIGDVVDQATITEENLDSELDKMEKQIEADIAAE